MKEAMSVSLDLIDIATSDDTWLYLITEGTVVNRPAVISTNGAGFKGTAAVAVCGRNSLGGGSRSEDGHANGNN